MMIRRALYVLAVIALMVGCIEPFEVETRGFEGVLVVDARLTDELKQHEVRLSRARPFEQDTVLVERNAQVMIIEDGGQTYDFEEHSSGTYVSTTPFAAQANRGYQLVITTANGEIYKSSVEEMPENVPIADVSAKRTMNDLGEEGVSIVVNNSSFGNQPRYFRYDYQEDYRIEAPNWDPFEFKIIDSIACTDGDAFEVIAVPKKSLKGRVCYGNRASSRIILASTANLEDNTIADFEVQFVNRENYILTHRYSIKVNQYTQSVDAHSYYQNLQSFSASESVFTETQPGFLSGNIVSENDSEKMVIGYFETAAISSRRLFFNYEELFPNEPLPEYPITCSRLGDPRLIPRGYHCTEGMSGVCDGNCESPLISQIQAKLIVFAGEKQPVDFIQPFFTLPRACGDCRVLGSDVKPDFWID